MIDLLGGRVAAWMGPVGVGSLPHIAEGRLRVLATTGSSPSTFVPNVPTFADQGFADIVATESYALFLPGGASAALAARGSEAVRIASMRKDYVAALIKAGVTAAWSTPDALAHRMKAEYDHWDSIVKSTGFKRLE